MSEQNKQLDTPDLAPDRRAAGVVPMLAKLVVVTLVIYLAGFVYFTYQIFTFSKEIPTKADAIVVLTGGPARIASGVNLLDKGRGQRLLITGVFEATTPQQLAAQIDNSEKLFECCIDLGKQALNTTGNALEAAQWARDKNYKNLIVVTAAYHMPRALAEFGYNMPEIALVPFAVFPGAATKEEGSTADTLNLARLSLLFSEYSKYLLAIFNHLFGRDAGGPGALATMSPQKDKTTGVKN